ncbi:hypothetical protein OHA18_41995 [Kribbella sp. NBC_00709]|nr:hypothetical protein [Kribbella sp. NBC_00709]
MNVVPDQRMLYVTAPPARTGTTNDKMDTDLPERAIMIVGAEART